MTTLKVGIASYEEMKARTVAVARGERRVSRDEPEGLVHLDRVVRQGAVGGNRELLRVIAEKAPGSLSRKAG